MPYVTLSYPKVGLYSTKADRRVSGGGVAWVCSGIAWDERAGDTLECLKDEPSDALALLAVKGRLDQLRRLYSHRSTRHVTRGEVYPDKYTIIGRQPLVILTRIGLY